MRDPFWGMPPLLDIMPVIQSHTGAVIGAAGSIAVAILGWVGIRLNHRPALEKATVGELASQAHLQDIQAMSEVVEALQQTRNFLQTEVQSLRETNKSLQAEIGNLRRELEDVTQFVTSAKGFIADYCAWVVELPSEFRTTAPTFPEEGS